MKNPKNKKIKSSNEGSTLLLMTLVILAAMLIISLSVSAIISNGLRAGMTQIHSTKAFFAAEAGAERILWEIRKNSFDPGEGIVGDNCESNPAEFCFSNQTDGLLNGCKIDCTPSFDHQVLSENNTQYSIKFDYDSSVSETEITSFGSYNGINRVIKLIY